jgi:hypothetical protein
MYFDKRKKPWQKKKKRYTLSTVIVTARIFLYNNEKSPKKFPFHIVRFFVMLQFVLCSISFPNKLEVILD